MLRHLITSWHYLKNEKSFRSEIKFFLLVSQVLSFGHQTQTSKNVADTTFKALKQNRKVPVQTLLSAMPGLGTQPHYEASGDPQAEIYKTQWVINIGLVRLSPQEWPRVGRGTADCSFFFLKKIEIDGKVVQRYIFNTRIQFHSIYTFSLLVTYSQLKSKHILSSYFR